MSPGDKRSSQSSVLSSKRVGRSEEIQVQDFKKLKVWEKSHQLTLDVYRAAAGFPKDELYGLTSQLRRACASLPANIAEGCGRGGKSELARFLQVAMGSASEAEYHLLLAHDLGLLNDAEYKRLEAGAVEVKRMLTSFIEKVRD
jgi:four helix bundle protein